MSLINCEISLILTWFNKLLLLSSATEATEFAITKTKLYVPVVTSSTEDNIKLWKLPTFTETMKLTDKKKLRNVTN